MEPVDIFIGEKSSFESEEVPRSFHLLFDRCACDCWSNASLLPIGPIVVFVADSF